jgi:hypothetical protein
MMNLRAPQKLGHLSGRVHNKLKKKRNKTETQCFMTNLQQFCNIYETSPATCLCFLQLYRVPSPVDKDKNVSVLLQFLLPEDRSQRSVDLLQCDEDMDLTTRKWSMEETCKLIFFVYSMLASPKNARHFALFISDASRGHAYCPHLLVYFT